MEEYTIVQLLLNEDISYMKGMRMLVHIMDRDCKLYDSFWTRCTTSENGIVTLTEYQKHYILQHVGPESRPVFSGIPVMHSQYYVDMKTDCFISHRSDIPDFLITKEDCRSWRGNTLTFSDILCGRSFSISTIIN